VSKLAVDFLGWQWPVALGGPLNNVQDMYNLLTPFPFSFTCKMLVVVTDLSVISLMSFSY